MSTALERWFEKRQRNPFRDLSKMEEAFERTFNRMFKDVGNDLGGEAPSCEVVEGDSSYTMKFDLPGIQKDQVKVEVDGDQLTVRAERHEERKEEDKKKFLSEISYGTYMRSFTLPSPIDENKVDAKFENGVLTLTVPKTELPPPKAKQIQIQ